MPSRSTPTRTSFEPTRRAVLTSAFAGAALRGSGMAARAAGDPKKGEPPGVRHTPQGPSQAVKGGAAHPGKRILPVDGAPGHAGAHDHFNE